MAAKRTKRYVDRDGCYLSIQEHNDYSMLAWYIPEYDDIGGAVGDCNEINLLEDNRNGKNVDQQNVECLIAYEAALPFATEDSKESKSTLEFDSLSKARNALKAANDALNAYASLSGQAEISKWPTWTLTAKENGWAPPEGWKP